MPASLRSRAKSARVRGSSWRRTRCRRSAPRLLAIRRPGRSAENDLFSGNGADVLVQAQHFDACDFLDHCFHDRPRGFDQMRPYLLEQVPTFLGRERPDHLLFSRGQDALKTDDEEIADQMGANVPGTPAKVLVLKAPDEFANGGFDLTAGFRRDPRDAPVRSNGGGRTIVYTWSFKLTHEC